MTALDDLAAYISSPDRPFDARALELVTAALEERRTGVPKAGHLGDDLDVPWQDAVDGTTVNLGDAVLAGGWVLSATVVPVPDVGPCPALVFRFSRYDGHLLRPVVLVLDEDQMRKAGTLATKAVGAAIHAARTATA